MRSRQIRALLAGGAVLGIGAVATLAAWNDSEHAAGTFSAGTFNLQGSATSATAGYDDHAAAGGAAATSGTLMGSASTLADNTAVTGAATSLPIGAQPTDAGAATQLCFVITAAPGLGQGGVTSAVWQLAATTS